ncbi:uncharacterized protein LOC116027491 isoform X1 [Ipomoea triloba]|uniref:uncharacterized protein LOC116027491 isoform X1 n=1 Tax=Ipomoea triloba TaxID=35885 RepID=UPI00125D4818|nr:uncharacterized protein LOC116027491 isoform X1 [Ipomoea triloba]
MSRLLHQLILHCITQLSSTMEEAKLEAPPQTLSPSSNGRTRRRRRRSSGSSSFEFCVLRKPNLLSADQLFSDGVLLPLHLLHCPSSADDHSPEPKRPDSSPVVELKQPNQPDSPRQIKRVEQPQLGAESGPEISAAPVASSSAAAAAETAAFSSSKRWRDIFKRSDKKGEKVNKDKKGGGGIFGGSNGGSAAERVLNINIWPFRRTKSAGNGGARPVGSGLSSPKASSAPCSGTNSPGDFKPKKSPSRSSLVWPARRSVGSRSYGIPTKPADKSPRKDRSFVERSFRKEGNKGWRKVSPAAADGGGGDWHNARILTMNASMSTDASTADATAGGISGEGPVRVNLRHLFTKKVY